MCLYLCICGLSWEIFKYSRLKKYWCSKNANLNFLILRMQYWTFPYCSFQISISIFFAYLFLDCSLYSYRSSNYCDGNYYIICILGEPIFVVWGLRWAGIFLNINAFRFKINLIYAFRNGYNLNIYNTGFTKKMVINAILENNKTLFIDLVTFLFSVYTVHRDNSNLFIKLCGNLKTIVALFLMVEKCRRHKCLVFVKNKRYLKFSLS